MKGLVVDRSGRAHVPTVVASGVELVSTVLCDFDPSSGSPLDAPANVARYADAGLAVLAVFARESLTARDGRLREPEEALRDYAARLGSRLWGIQAGNEYSNPDGGASWVMGAFDQSVLHRQAARAFREVNPGIRVVSGAVGTGQPDDLAALDLSQCDLAGVHLYDEWVDGLPAQGWNGAALPLLDAFARASVLPLAITEWSTTADAAAASYIRLSAAAYRAHPAVAVDCYFRYADPPGDEHFGLFSADGNPSERWDAFRKANGVTIHEPEVPMADETWAEAKSRIEEQIHLLVENQRRILQGDWQTARIFLDAIDPSMAGKWTNATFPGPSTASPVPNQ